MKTTMAVLCAAALLAGCATAPAPERAATITRTTHGVAHISAPDIESLGYGVAYAYAQDNACMVLDALVTARGERSRWHGEAARALLGRRMLRNDQIDFFIAAHIDDAALAARRSSLSADAQAMARGYIAGFNRYLSDAAGRLPAECNGQPWVQPMTAAEYWRMIEISIVQASAAAFADGIVGAAPPAGNAAAPAEVQLADAAQAMREIGVLEPTIGSNAWAFGRDSSASGSGVLLGNPHFPWAGMNRFWQAHLTLPGRFDVMGATGGALPVVTIGFNKDVAWSHTVSTGRRFTLHELTLVAGDPTSYLVDGQPVKMSSRQLTISVRGADGQLQTRSRQLWSTRYGPVLVNPQAGLNWTAQRAYALQDANSGNVRGFDTWLAFASAKNVGDLRSAMANLGLPWVNTIAADRAGNAMYADMSVVPDVDAAMLQRCAPSPAAARLFAGAGLPVLDGSKSDCNWRRDSGSPVPGLIPPARMPVAVRGDWVQNSNDSFAYTHPAQRFEGISPLVGTAALTRVRTRSSLSEIPDMLARGKVDNAALQRQLFENRNFTARVVLPDLLAACATQPPAAQEARDGCAALRGWSRNNEVDARGAHLFREFWRGVMATPRLWRVPFDAAQPVATPQGLNFADAEVAAKLWEGLAKAVTSVRSAGFALDAPLGSVQRPLITEEAIALHGGEEFEGVLNNLGNQFAPGISNRGLRIDYGTSYVQTVSFDARGPVAQALLTYGQSTHAASPHAFDQLRLFSRKEWPTLPFHAEDVARARLGEPVKIVRP